MDIGTHFIKLVNKYIYQTETTSEMGKLLNAFKQELEDLYSDVNNTLTNLQITKASGIYLDFLGRTFGLLRKSNETDDKYRKRILGTIIQEKITKNAIENIVKKYFDDYTITYYNNDKWDGADTNNILPFQIKLEVKSTNFENTGYAINVGVIQPLNPFIAQTSYNINMENKVIFDYFRINYISNQFLNDLEFVKPAGIKITILLK